MRVYLILALLVVFSSCVKNKKGQVVEIAAPTNAKVFEVVEVVQANSYSYLKVKENFSERWVAVTKQEFAVGDVYYYDSALEMRDFISKDLDRTFDVVYFVNAISKTPLNQMPQNAMGAGAPAHSGKVETKEKSTVTLEKGDKEITIAQVFANRKDYSSKEFEIRGVVVKVNKQVMGKNWIHIQDGTNDAGNFDLTVTTQGEAEVGDEVTFKGKLTLNKDFGAGYSYEVIMEDAVLASTKAVSTQL
ncbi:MAG: hypothetical protein HQ522_06780 [Bacteroidetes bacterium]|nr:hypothetical protein [Bacteroidota bacterium]